MHLCRKLVLAIVASEIIYQGAKYIYWRIKNMVQFTCNYSADGTHEVTTTNKNCTERYYSRVLFFPDKTLITNLLPENNKPPANVFDATGEELSPQRLLERYGTDSALAEVVRCLDAAHRTIDVCVLLLTCTHLAQPLIRAKQRGVHVRVLLDRNMATVDGSQLATLRSKNIAVRLHNCTAMMHHKFALVDVTIGDSDAIPKAHDTITGNPEAHTENLNTNNGNRDAIPGNDRTIKTDCPVSGLLLNGSFNWTWSAVVCNTENIIITNSPDLVVPFMKQFQELWLQAAS